MPLYKRNSPIGQAKKMALVTLLQSVCYLLGFCVLTCAVYTVYLYAKIRLRKRQAQKNRTNFRNELVFVKVDEYKMIDRCIIVVEDIEPYKKHYHTFRLQV